MDYLWTPWRYAYVKSADSTPGCVFCRALEAGDDRKNWMVLPNAHLDELGKLSAAAAHEMMDLCRKVEAALREVYRPDGVNLGMNIGKAAGAGVAGHIHMHMLPRWLADSNFMTVVGETRVLPETLDQTWERLKAALGG
jgi:ATP adenylyltransferase